MSGQTKLIGFSADGKSIQLERWGKKALVEVGGEVVIKLKEVCHDVLPVVPHRLKTAHSFGFEVSADLPDKSIGVQMDVDNAIELSEILSEVSEDPGLSEEKRLEYTGRALILAEVAKKVRDYSDLKEPGIG